MGTRRLLSERPRRAHGRLGEDEGTRRLCTNKDVPVCARETVIYTITGVGNRRVQRQHKRRQLLFTKGILFDYFL